MMLLYDHPVSSNALKVRVLLAELELAYERREVPIERPRPDWYLALNPLGGIPALHDGAVVVSESNTILRYLATREGRGDLYPADPAGRARVDEFLDRWSLTFRPAFFAVEAAALGFVPGRGFVAANADLELAREREAGIAETIGLLDSLVGSESVLGTFTIADCAVAPVLFRTLRTGMDLTGYANLAALRTVLVARPAFARAGAVT